MDKRRNLKKVTGGKVVSLSSPVTQLVGAIITKAIPKFGFNLISAALLTSAFMKSGAELEFRRFLSSLPIENGKKHAYYRVYSIICKNFGMWKEVVQMKVKFYSNSGLTEYAGETPLLVVSSWVMPGRME